MKREQFILPENAIYMCGHSLGPSSHAAKNKVAKALEDWSQFAVSGWNVSEWIDLPLRIGASIAMLIGANPHDVVVSDSTSVNLYKVLHGACLLNAKRKIILTDYSNFPADLYIAQGIKSMHVQYAKSENILAFMNHNVAVLMLTHVNYRTGQIYDMKKLTEYAHDLGIIVIWDLSHSIGAMPLNLNDCDVDFAVGCTYKYLNGGPGAPSFVYLNQRHHGKAINPIMGWMAHQAPFDFTRCYQPMNNAAKYLVGTPYILSLKSLEGALEIYKDLDMFFLREKSLEYSEYIMGLIEQGAPALVCESPAQSSLRGGHIAFSHEHAYAISRALIANGVICDYREPNLIRLCVHPLYLIKNEIKRCAKLLIDIMQYQQYLELKYHHKLKVT